ncbi:MAG TPA: hypothetical protein VFM80_08690 [Gracilimonas sp.]|uniref:hypothetical protein n=1 Tax=Gracilimonas sp. TaxID=1974203 RepID=UPI002DB31EE4|nr:hypothetical protein [Gracilimonas sp.]
MKYPWLLLIFLSVFSCNSMSQDNTEIVQKALNIPEVRKYFHPEMKSRTPYYLLKTDYVDKGSELFIFGIPTTIIEEQNIRNENYIEITRFIKNNSEVKISYYYKIENIEVSAELKKVNGKWQVKSYKTFQF